MVDSGTSAVVKYLLVGNVLPRVDFGTQVIFLLFNAARRSERPPFLGGWGEDLFAGAHTAHSRNTPTVSVGSAASFRIDHPDLLQNEHSSMASTEIQRIA